MLPSQQPADVQKQGDDCIAVHREPMACTVGDAFLLEGMTKCKLRQSVAAVLKL